MPHFSGDFANLASDEYVNHSIGRAKVIVAFPF